MISGRAADLLRDVPETAVRLYLGAKAEQNDDGIRIELDNKSYIISPEAHEMSQRIANALLIRPREITYATEVLELRHEAEEHLLSMIYGEAANVPQILFVPAGEGGAAFYRALMPADTMTDNGLALAHHTMRLDVSKAIRYNVLWIQLVAAPVLHQIASIAKKEGVKIVYDVDDNWEQGVKDSNPAADLYSPGSKHSEEVWKMVELADVVTVSTKTLADVVRSRAKEVVVIPNMVPASIWPNVEPPDPKTRRILWAGSPSHKADLEIVAPALSRILERNKDVRFCCFGENTPEALLPVKDQVDLVPFIDFGQYYEVLSRLAPHFAIAPLQDNGFNASKSAVKFLEYSACGYHTLMSPVGEYKEIDFENRSLVEDSQWEAAIEWHLTHPDETRQAGANAREWVRKNRCLIKSKAQAWLDVASSLMTANAKA